MTFPPYGNYRESGVEWLGEVPSHWRISPIKRSFDIVGGSTPKSEEQAYWDGKISWITPADLSQLDGIDIFATTRTITSAGLASCAATLVPAGTVVLSTRAPIGSLGITTSEVCTNQGCKSLVSRDVMSAHFLAYVLNVAKRELNIRGKGTTFLELSSDELGSFQIPVPSTVEQTRIVDFLDRETAKIDGLIEAQRRLIELLKEKRQAVTSHAVTKGLDPAAPMKPSGVEWLGDVPAHWKVLQFGRVIDQIEQGWSPPAHDRQPQGDEAGVLRLSAVKNGNFVPNERKALPNLSTKELAAAPLLRDGDFLLTRANTPDLVGDCATAQPLANTVFPDLIYRISFQKNELLPDYAVLIMRSTYLRFQIRSHARGSSMSMAKLSHSHIKSFWLALPSTDEQYITLKKLKSFAVDSDKLIVSAELGINLLQERRAALISAAVTGKIDVRDLASNFVKSTTAEAA